MTDLHPEMALFHPAAGGTSICKIPYSRLPGWDAQSLDFLDLVIPPWRDSFLNWTLDSPLLSFMDGHKLALMGVHPATCVVTRKLIRRFRSWLTYSFFHETEVQA